VPSLRFLRSGMFWKWFGSTFLVLGFFFGWELGLFISVLPSPTTIPSTTNRLFISTLIVLLSLNIGLLRWQSTYGTCPIGTKRATTAAGALGAFVLLCPVCLLLPLSLAGLSIAIGMIAAFLPLLRIIALILAIASTVFLWPRH
jgi:hypothetical protein